MHEWEKEKLDAMVDRISKKNAFDEGMKTKTIDIVKAMLESKTGYDFISKVTGKTVEEIKEIEKSMEEME